MRYRMMILGALALMLAACDEGGSVNSNPPGGGGSALEDIVLPLPSSTTGVAKPVSNRVVGALPLIGANGGSLTSEDGLLTLVVPVGAVSDFAAFGIQLVENNMPGGIGLAYRVTAKTNNGSGQDVVLAKPLELVFSFPSSKLTETLPEDLRLAYQGSDGRWQISADQQAEVIPQADSSVRFSGKFQKSGDYAVAPRYKLHPARGNVKVNAKLLLTVFKLSPTTVVSGNGSYSLFDFTKVSATGWAVGGIAEGNDAVGRLISTDKDSQKQYKAPSRKPSPNPVKVTAQISDGGRTVTVVSLVKVEDSKGWLDLWADVLASKTFTGQDVGRLSIEANAQYQLDVTESLVSAPTILNGKPISGFANYRLTLRPGGSMTAKITYTLRSVRPCICTPNEGNIERNYAYNFTAVGEPRLTSPQNTFLGGSVEPSGAYSLAQYVGVGIDGNYTYTFNESYPCGDRQPRAPINESGTDTIAIASSGVVSDIRGTVNPQGPDRLKGIQSGGTLATLPTKSLDFESVYATLITSWFLPYEPISAQQVGNFVPKDKLALLQGRVLTQPLKSSSQPSISLARLLDRPGLEPEPNLRYTACKASELPTVHSPKRSTTNPQLPSR